MAKNPSKIFIKLYKTLLIKYTKLFTRIHSKENKCAPMQESLIYISKTMNVFSTKITWTLIKCPTFNLVSENLK